VDDTGPVGDIDLIRARAHPQIDRVGHVGNRIAEAESGHGIGRTETIRVTPVDPGLFHRCRRWIVSVRLRFGGVAAGRQERTGQQDSQGFANEP
jgi:hypothetical protein